MRAPDTVKSEPKLIPKSIVKYKWIVFVTPDSTYKATLFYDPLDYFYIAAGHVDSINLPDRHIIRVVKKRQGDTIYSYQRIRETDTINTYYPGLKSYTPMPVKRIERIVYYYTWDLLDDIDFSYTYNNFNKSALIQSTDTILRMIHKVVRWDKPPEYTIIELRMNGCLAILTSCFSVLLNTGEYKTPIFKSDTIRQKDNVRMRSIISQCEKKSWSMREDGDLYLLECRLGNNYFNMIFTENYSRSKNLAPYSKRLYYFLNELCGKYLWK